MGYEPPVENKERERMRGAGCGAKKFNGLLLLDWLLLLSKDGKGAKGARGASV